MPHEPEGSLPASTDPAHPSPHQGTEPQSTSTTSTGPETLEFNAPTLPAPQQQEHQQPAAPGEPAGSEPTVPTAPAGPTYSAPHSSQVPQAPQAPSSSNIDFSAGWSLFLTVGKSLWSNKIDQSISLVSQARTATRNGFILVFLAAWAAISILTVVISLSRAESASYGFLDLGAGDYFTSLISVLLVSAALLALRPLLFKCLFLVHKKNIGYLDAVALTALPAPVVLPSVIAAGILLTPGSGPLTALVICALVAVLVVQEFLLYHAVNERAAFEQPAFLTYAAIPVFAHLVACAIVFSILGNALFDNISGSLF